MALDSTTKPAQLDADNPWPGLAWFDESAAAFFNGRQREIAELKRLLLQAPLTVLFGRSGLGKTSLLKAGLFPELRRSGLLPVYTRFDFAAGTGAAGGEHPLVEQLASSFAVAAAAAKADAPPRASGESLWEYLHRSISSSGVRRISPSRRYSSSTSSRRRSPSGPRGRRRWRACARTSRT